MQLAGEDEVVSFGDEDGFFEHSREGTVDGIEGPAVGAGLEMVIAHRVHDLDGEGLAGLDDNILRPRIGIARDGWLFVEVFADAVAGEVPDDGIAGALDNFLHSLTNLID